MKRLGKLILGAATLWPLAWGVALGILILATYLRERSGHPGPLPEPLATLGTILYIFVSFALLEVPFLLVFYLLYLFRARRITTTGKALWAVALLLGSVLAMPVFFFIYIWPEPPRPAPGVQPSAP